MFNRFLLLLLTSSGLHVNAQTIDQISAGAGYAKSGYYKLSDGTSVQTSYDAWDIAFSNLGAQHAGIFINEGTATSMGQPLPGLEAYNTGSTDFSLVVTSASLTADKQVLNPETSWSDGAFNSVRNPSDPFDLGWGAYNPQTHQIIGTRVFALKMRNGSYRKILFESYDGQTYQFKSANLDGTNPQTHSVSKSVNNGSPVVYFSFANNNPITPTNWDLVFCRYSTPLFDGQGYIPYSVTGILSGEGVSTAKAVAVDPVSVDYHDFLDSLKTRLDVIGHDWKSFGSSWSVASDRAYFVKTKSNQLYKLVFFDFEGSSTGTATFEKTLLTTLSATQDLPAGILEAAVFPNPVLDRLNISFTAESASDVSVQLLNTAGQLLWTGNSRVQTGLNVLEINNLPSLKAGQYVLTLQFPSGQFSRIISAGNSR